MLYPTVMDSTSEYSELSVKIVLNGEMRRFPFTGKSFQALDEKIHEVFGLEKSIPIVLKYTDEDSDLITISTDGELKSAVVPGKLLRLEAFVKNVPSAPISTPAPAPAPVPTPSVPPAAAPRDPFQAFASGASVPTYTQPMPAGAPMMFSAFGRGAFAGPCMGRNWAEYKKLKRDLKDRSPEQWAAYKEQFKQMKDQHKMAKKSFHKMMKHGGRPGLHAAMFGAGPLGFPPGPHGPHHMHHAFRHGYDPRFDQPQDDAAPPPAQEDGASAPPADGFGPHPEFVPPFGPGFGRGGFGRGGLGFGRGFGRGFGHPYFGPHPFFQHDEKLVARHVKDVTIEDGTRVPAGTHFVKTWRIRNEGQPWPAGCRLTSNSHEKHKGSDNMSGPEYVVVEQAVEPNQEVDISVPLVAPSKPGRYTGYWKMRTPDDRKFGQRLWVTIVVPSTSSSSSEEDREADRIEALVDMVLGMGFTTKRHRVFRLLQKFDGDVDKVALILADKQQKAEHKAAEKAQKAAMMTD